MTRTPSLVLGITTGLLVWVVGTAAADPAAKPDVAACKNGATIVPLTGAPLYRVESGLFQVQENQVTDLTDRMVTFKFTPMGKKGAARAHVNGVAALLQPGQRLDLTRFGPLGDTFADRKACFLDLIKSTKPRGAPAVAVFRFHCI